MQTKFIRFDSVGGASGDMILASLVALGADLKAIEAQINGFFPEQIHLSQEAVSDAGLHGIRIRVGVAGVHEHDDRVWPDAESTDDHDHESEDPHVHDHAHDHHHPHDHDHHHGHGHHHHDHEHDHHHDHHHRGLPEIRELLLDSTLSDSSKKLALNIFQELAVAEARIHGKDPETVHFHEVGAWDSVADIVGVVLALEQLGVAGISCGPLPAGIGVIHCAHGVMPNPAPATQELLQGMLVVQSDEPYELVTPTGAALLRGCIHHMQEVPAESVVSSSAFGFGHRKLLHRPNVIRATLLSTGSLGSTPDHQAPTTGLVGDKNSQPIVQLECNLDDCTPELLGALTDDLLEAGALDVWIQPVYMKKGRPGSLLGVLSAKEKLIELREMIFHSTTTLGMRWFAVEREVLERRFVEADTCWGKIPIKVGYLHGRPVSATPEFSVCQSVARNAGVMPRQVYEAAMQAYATGAVESADQTG